MVSKLARRLRATSDMVLGLSPIGGKTIGSKSHAVRIVPGRRSSVAITVAPPIE